MDSREKFLRLADELSKDDSADPWTKEPWPTWLTKIVLRLARVFAPSLTADDFRANRERFEGFGLAFVTQCLEEARKVDKAALPNNPLFDGVKAALEEMEAVDAPKLEAALRAATDLPTEAAGEVFAAYGEGLKKGVAKFGIDRLRDNNTAQVCLFLIFARPWIEGKTVMSVTELFQSFMKIREAFPGQREFFARHPNARTSLERQFRNICSEEGVKVRQRGRPRKFT
jgi:hypothetical protein